MLTLDLSAVVLGLHYDMCPVMFTSKPLRPNYTHSESIKKKLVMSGDNWILFRDIKLKGRENKCMPNFSESFVSTLSSTFCKIPVNNTEGCVDVT